MRATHPEIPVAEDYDEGLFYHAQKRQEQDREELHAMKASWSPTNRRVIQWTMIILGTVGLVRIIFLWR